MTKLCLLFCVSIGSVALAQQWPDGQGKDTTLLICSTCHKPDVIQEHRQTRDDWKASIQKMISAGAEGSPEQFTTVLDYVSKNFGPTGGSSAPATTAQAPPDAGRGGRGGRNGGGGVAGGGRRAGGF